MFVDYNRETRRMPNCFCFNKNMFAHDLNIDESPGSVDNPKRVLVVMDALREFQIEFFEWVLRNFILGDCRNITLLGIAPWLNIPLSSKTWSNIWGMDLDDLSTFEEKTEFKNDPTYQKVQQLIQLCQKYGVDKADIRTEMGHPLQLLVIEQISNLNATLVVFDRHHERRYIDFYAEKIPCNMVVVNDNGDVDLIKKRKRQYDTPVDEPDNNNNPPI